MQTTGSFEKLAEPMGAEPEIHQLSNTYRFFRHVPELRTRHSTGSNNGLGERFFSFYGAASGTLPIVGTFLNSGHFKIP